MKKEKNTPSVSKKVALKLQDLKGIKGGEAWPCKW